MPQTQSQNSATSNATTQTKRKHRKTAGVSLCRLKPGQVGTILSVHQTDEVQATRIMSLGLCTGRQIELIKQGNPLILRVFGSRIGIARRLAARISVIPCDLPNCSALGELP